MDGVRLSLLFVIFILIVLSGLFSATETAYTSVNTIKLKSLSLKDKRYKKVYNLYEKYDRLLSTILVGNNIVNISVSSLSMVFFASLLKTQDVALISTLVVTIIVVLFGEIAPKNISKSYPEKIALLNYPFIITMYYVLYPINMLLTLFKKLLNVIFRLNHEDAITDEELITIVNEAEEDGTLKQDESSLIKSAIEFDDLEVRDILIPRIDVVAVNIDSSYLEIKSIFEKERYSRLPVYKDNIDTIVGFIHEKDFYRTCNKDTFNINDILQEVLFVVEHTKISALLKKLQSKKVHIAVVLDEYGGTLGIATMEDIIEELVGEIYDEYDEEEKEIRKTESGEYIVSGSCNLDDFFELFNTPILEDEFDANTVGGLVTEKLGELPKIYTKFEYKNLIITVTKCTKKRILEVKVKINEDYKEEDTND